jgi:alanyl-tRNA synthetase
MEAGEKKVTEKAGADLGKRVEELLNTRLLFYEDLYRREFNGEVISVLDDKYVVLDQTIFYAEGGGQVSDRGILESGDKKYRVQDVQNIEGVIIHEVDRPGLKKGDRVHGVIDWDCRIALMRAHTATHIILGAARRVLGEHVWQAGASKGVEQARLDISHYARLTRDEVEQIEKLANQIVHEGRPVSCKFMQRDKAEKKYGFRLYQGGAVPGKEIRIVDMGDWDAEACGGTHLANTNQAGLIKIVGTEKVQDGVERLIYAVGPYALKEVQRRESLLMDAAEMIGAPYDKIEESISNTLGQLKELRSQLDNLQKAMSKQKAKELVEKATEVEGVKVVFYSDKVDFEFLIELGNQIEEFDGDIVLVMMSTSHRRFGVKAGQGAMSKGVHAGNVTSKLGKLLGGSGGGASYFGQGGGADPDKFLSVQKEILDIIFEQVS